MKTSTFTDPFARAIGLEKTIELIAKAGFDAWDFSTFDMCRYDWETKRPFPSDHPLAGDNYLAYVRNLKRIASDNGIVCNQSHAPFPTCCKEARSYFKRALECTAEAGGKICIIHPDNDKCAEENAEMYFDLLPFAKGCGVKIATENMWNWDDEKDESCFAACATAEDFLKHIQLVNDDYLIACVDIGHAEMRGSGEGAANLIRALGHHVQALHIHDNDKWKDWHKIPFSMNIDFAPIVQALKDINYSGEFTLEANPSNPVTDEASVFSELKALSASVRKLADMFEA